MLWVLDTGRPTAPQSGRTSMAYAVPGGSKLVAVDLATDTITRTYTLPPTVHYKDLYMVNLRFDLQFNPTESGALHRVHRRQRKRGAERVHHDRRRDGEKPEPARSAPEYASSLRGGAQLSGPAVLLLPERSSSVVSAGRL
ncbi:hypothetical protein DL770_005593 [Monosporascus sp. CRB-9-2]|nr:hypothetical protein DL770_005593 [Monosporascus sp. CRB-9-2]